MKNMHGFAAGQDGEEEVDLIAEYEEAKNDYCCPIELRELDLKGETAQHYANKAISNVLVIITGGTLCMVESDHGY